MNEITFIQWLTTGHEYVLAFAGLCGALGVIATIITKTFETLNKPHEELKAKVDSIGQTVETHDEFFKRDYEMLEQGKAERSILMKGLMQLITHELDGNHVDKLTAVRDEMQDYLIER